MTAHDPASVADRYFEAIRAHDAGAIETVFAENAQLVNAGGTVHGRDAIVDFYRSTAFTVEDLEPNPGPYVIQGDRLAVEINLRMGGKDHRVADFFEIREGLVQRLSIYMLPAS
jgi:hypothetical protein